ncbi:hypothetical protein RSK20926_03319 [Roseobacter sp. SK209-2-6]|nr:hypothetical protein RSK20926_03319 [Roseobacter sp. SK209-2-6]
MLDDRRHRETNICLAFQYSNTGMPPIGLLEASCAIGSAMSFDPNTMAISCSDIAMFPPFDFRREIRATGIALLWRAPEFLIEK